MKDWKKFIVAALIRAVRTLAQTAIATIGTTALLTEVNWAVVASASGLAAILSILTSIAGLPEVTLEQKPDIPEGYFEDEPDEESEGEDGE